jgi:guanosine-3',5'-bis(diphosphate) 3'-pyrophosphohydrolase
MPILSPVPTDGNGDPEEHSVALPLPAALLERLIATLRRYLPPSDVALVREVTDFAATATRSPAILRDMLTVGEILAQMHIVDATGITAGMLHHAAIDPETHAIDPALLERIALEFGSDVTALIQSIAQFRTLESQRKSRQLQSGARKRESSAQARHQQLEKVRKMFVGMGDDPRVVIFMLADHLLHVRAKDVPPDEATLLAEESRDIYAPLAARLGMARVESELEDRAFAQLEPDEFRRVSNLVEQIRREQQQYIDRVCTILKEEAAKIGIVAEVSGRYKHLWSIYRKLERNGWDIKEVYDLIAFRVIVPEVPDCYAMLGQVHALWPPKEERIKDFIAHKKPNGYQSLHTTVFCLDKRLAEIQIRTAEMHKNAEYGAAVHWYYKDVGDQAQLDKSLGPWIKQIRDWQSDLQTYTAGQDTTIPSEGVGGGPSRIFIFTPQGDVKDLPFGSTPVDFAYQIHTTLGDHCAGARIIASGAQVAKRLVPLDHELESGQIVEIITRKDAHPTRDWLKFVRTHAARTHINRYLKQHERDIYITIGRERLDADMRKVNLGSLEALSEENLNAVMQQLDYHAAEDIFADIGGGTLRPSAVIQAIQARIKITAPPAPEKDADKPTITAMPTSDAVLDLAGGGLLARLANCCRPLPPDPIMGYISRGRGIVIHNERCRSLARLREREGERLVPVTWRQMRLDRYEAPLIVLANDRTGLMRDVTQQIQEMKLNMQSVSSLTNRKGLATISLTLQLQISPQRKNDEGAPLPDEVQVKQQLDEAIRRIAAIRDVVLVQRDTRALLAE